VATILGVCLLDCLLDCYDVVVNMSYANMSKEVSVV
jgi:hypothetical protein